MLLLKNDDKILSFDKGSTLSDVEFISLTSIDIASFNDLATHLVYIRDTKVRSSRTYLGIFLTKIRSGMSNKLMTTIFNVRKDSIRRAVATVRKNLMQTFVPKHLGFNHISREKLIENHTRPLAQTLFGNEFNPAILVIDVTYIHIYTEKRSISVSTSYIQHAQASASRKILRVCKYYRLFCQRYGSSSWCKIDAASADFPSITEDDLRNLTLDVYQIKLAKSYVAEHVTENNDFEHGGLNVDCQVTKLGTVVTFSEYRDGMATVLLVNHTEKSMIQFNQSDVLTKHSLKAKQYLLYTWENSTCKREIIWACGQTKNQKNDLQQDKIGEVSVHDNSKIYWVSFMNGLQRCLLFTEDLGFATVAHEAVGPERLKLEINICMQGLGLSLVNDYKQIEVAYLGVRSSGILWEEKKERFTILNRETGETLEKAYQQYVAELEKGHTPTARISLNRNIEVDWNDMMMYKPNKISIRRRVQKGIWLQIKTSPHQKNNSCQYTETSASEPCTKLRILTGNPNHGKILQFKYVKAIFEQEMTLKVDLRFINELFALLPTSASYSRDQQKRLIENDYQTANAAFKIGTKPSLGNIHVYDHLSISPIKVSRELIAFI
ncbi:VPS13A_C [Mytilus coruscus]|uniref:VPS13A_C n=1 Tax=Mytilus coruscus TaxID=42192 RepID=A0A6J8EUH3_MYTCO|nr:VPS13A_C [Mytilus coruscus]